MRPCATRATAPRCAGTSTPSSPRDRWSAGARIACSSWCTTANRTRRAATRARTASTSISAAKPRSAPPGEPVSPEPQAAQIAIGIVVDGVPVVDELGEQAQRLRADDVGEAQREIRVRLVEARAGAIWSGFSHQYARRRPRAALLPDAGT